MAAKQRSPNYPAVDLGSATGDVKTLYQKNGRTRIGLEVAAKALGYRSLSGPARSRIAALRHYGLIDMSGGMIQPNGRGLVLSLRSPDSPEYKAAVREAALTPEIFRELAQTHMQASEDALRHYLVAVRKFSDDGARRLSQTFKATMRLVSLEEASYDQDISEPAVQEGRIVTGSAQLQGSASMSASAQVLHPETYRWRLPGNVIAEVRFIGGDATPRRIESLKQYLNLMEQALGDNEPQDE
jgi:hypothetical protein